MLRFPRWSCLLTSYYNWSIVEQAKYTYPMGYVVKPFDENNLHTAIEIARHNFARLIHPSRLTRSRINKLLEESITKNEFDILEGVCQGMTNKQLSYKYFVNVNTVNNHLKSIYTKLGVHSRTETIARLSS